MSDDFIHAAEHLTFRSIPTSAGHHQAQSFVSDLDRVALRDFSVAARILATTLASGRPPSGRSRRVAGSSEGLFELRITPPGRGGPQHRLLFVRCGDTIWVARGLTKRERITRRDIDLADDLVRRWRAGR